MRAITPSGTVPEHDRRQDEMAQCVQESARLVGQERVDRHETGRLVEIIVDEVDAARHRQEPEPDRDEHDEQQAPPEDRHRIAEQRYRHQRLVEDAAALDRRDRPGRHADDDGEQHGEERQLERRREKRQELGQHLLLGRRATRRNRRAGASRRSRGTASRPAGRVRVHGGSRRGARARCRARRP